MDRQRGSRVCLRYQGYHQEIPDTVWRRQWAGRGYDLGELERKGLPALRPRAYSIAWTLIQLTPIRLRLQSYLFGGIQFQLSVPDKWINSFKTGATWDAPASPDPKNGHGIHFNGVDANGHYKIQTWGTHGWITPAGVAACDPSAFVVASLRWFNSAGYAPNGLHYTQLAPLWVQLGGSPWPASPFPAPAPTPTPTPPQPTPIPPSPDYPMSGSYQFGIYKIDWTASVNDPIPNPPVTGR